MKHHGTLGRLVISAVAATLFVSVGATSAFARATESAHLAHGSNGQPNSSGVGEKGEGEWRRIRGHAHLGE